MSSICSALLILVSGLLLFTSCKSETLEYQKRDWSNELLGFGELFEHPDSVRKPIKFSPVKMDLFDDSYFYEFAFTSEVNCENDTCIIHAAFPKTDLYALNQIHKDSIWCKYRPVKLWNNLFAFLKLEGAVHLPNVFFYQTYPSFKDSKFEYYFASELNHNGENKCFLEISSSIELQLVDMRFSKQSAKRLILTNRKDVSVAYQAVNFAINSRYDTIDWQNSEAYDLGFYSGYQYLVFDSQIYEYNSMSKYDFMWHQLFHYFGNHPDWVETNDENTIEKWRNYKPRRFESYPLVIIKPRIELEPPTKP